MIRNPALRFPAVVRVMLWMTGALISFSMMAISGREAGAFLETSDLIAWRSLIGALIVFIVARVAVGDTDQLRPRFFRHQLLRNILHFFGQYCWYTALMLIPMAQLFAIEFSSPIWVALLAPLILGERMTRARLIAVGMGFAGILIVVRPEFAADSGGLLAGSVAIGTLWAIGSAFGFAGNTLATKPLSGKVTPLAIIFYMCVLQLPMALAVRGGLPTLPPAPEIWFWVLVLSCGGLTSHFCMVRAFQIADATTVAPMDMLRLPLISTIGALFYAEALDIWVLLGGAIIALGNFCNLRAEARRERRQRAYPEMAARD